MLENLIYLLSIPAFVVWIALLRQPGELLSFYDRSLIWIEEIEPVLHKILTCSFCHTGYVAILCIFVCDLHWFILPGSMVIYRYFSILLKVDE